MIKVTYFEDDKTTVCGCEYFEDEALEEFHEAVEDYGEEYVSIEFDSRDFVGYELDKYITKILKKVCIRAIENGDIEFEEDEIDTTPPKFSEKFEKNMENVIRRVRNQRF